MKSCKSEFTTSNQLASTCLLYEMIPIYLHREIILEGYLNLFDIIQLDTATCNHHYRDIFLNQILHNQQIYKKPNLQPVHPILKTHSYEFSKKLNSKKSYNSTATLLPTEFESNKPSFTSFPYLLWLARRKLRINSLCITNESMNTETDFRILSTYLYPSLSILDQLEDYDFYNLDNDDDMVNNVNIYELDCSKCSGLMDHQLESLTLGCHQLLSINLHHCYNLTPQCHLKELLSKNNQLIHLNISRCSEIITDDLISFISGHLVQLQTVDLSHNNLLSNGSINKLISNCQQIQKLSIEGCRKLTCQIYYDIARSCREATHFDLYGKVLLHQPIVFPMETIERQHFPHRSLSKITCFSIKQCLNIHDSFFIHMIDQFPQLTQIHLNNCPRIITQSIIHLISNTKHLQSISLTLDQRLEVGQIIDAISKTGNQLQSFTLASEQHLTDDSIIQLGVSCPSLLHIELHHCNGFEGHGFISLIKSCRSLQSFVLIRKLQQVHDHPLPPTLYQEVSSCGTELTTFRLHDNISNDSLMNICQRCTKLQSIEIGYSQQLTLAAVHYIQHHCQNVKQLKVLFCSNVNI